MITSFFARKYKKRCWLTDARNIKVSSTLNSINDQQSTANDKLNCFGKMMTVQREAFIKV
jgi:hypothetical protein